MCLQLFLRSGQPKLKALGDVLCPCSMMRKEGDVSFNGAPPNKNMKRSMGFVMQVPPVPPAMPAVTVLCIAHMFLTARTVLVDVPGQLSVEVLFTLSPQGSNSSIYPDIEIEVLVFHSSCQPHKQYGDL